MKLPPKILAALDIANEVHREETRKDADGLVLPYMSHIYDILKLAKRVGITYAHLEICIAIILHDTMESGMPFARLLPFGSGTAGHVSELSFDEKVESKAAYMASFLQKSLVALVTKVLDRICNVRDFWEAGDPYAFTYFHKADRLFKAFRDREAEIVGVLGQEIFNRMVEEIDAIAQLEKVAA